MESEGIRITQRELHRYHVLKMVLGGHLTLRAAAELLGVSYRQAVSHDNRALTTVGQSACRSGILVTILLLVGWAA